MDIIISALLSGTIAVLISVWYYSKHEKYQMKLNTIKNLVGYRYDMKGEKFSKALNEIFFVFKESNDVLKSLRDFYRLISKDEKSTEDAANDSLFMLFSTMCEELKIDYSIIDKSFFVEAFNVRKWFFKWP